MLDILTSVHFLKSGHSDSDDFMGNLKSLHVALLMHDDVILRLCKLADEDTRSWSFDQAIKAVRNKTTADDPELNRMVRAFKAAVRPIKLHRDQRIAHRAKRDRTNLTVSDFAEPIQLALQILDRLSNSTVEYKIQDFDLRGPAMAARPAGT
jgi:hypothetical protein